MAAVSVLVGREEKEISGLTRKTTCADVLQALLKERAKEAISPENNEDLPNEELTTNKLKAKDFRDLAKDYVITENWRGCEKPLAPQTRLLAVWQAWGKEQCHVKFSLKKDKNIRFRLPQQCREHASLTQHNDLMDMINQEQNNLQSDAVRYHLTHDQKKRIRRNMMQYQRALLMQHTKVGVDDNNNMQKTVKRSTSTDHKTTAGNGTSSSRQQTTKTSEAAVTLSEEQFVDGILTGPDCILRHEGKSKFIRNAFDNKEFNREHCTYRRPHHRRRSLMQDESEKLAEQTVTVLPEHKFEIHRNSHSSNARRRSNSRRRRHSKRPRGRLSKQSLKHRTRNGRYSTDSTTTSTGTPSTASELELETNNGGEDADDEKSILTDISNTISRPTQVLYPASVRSTANHYGGAAVSTGTVVVTDSSSGTTTCSETSNTSVSSISSTSSYDTSCTGDVEALFIKRPQVATKTTEKSKSTSGASKLFRKVKGPSLAKPAQSLLGSFKKKRKAPQGVSLTPAASNNGVDCAPTTDVKTPAKVIPTSVTCPEIAKERASSRQQPSKTPEKSEVNSNVITKSSATENTSSHNGIQQDESRSSRTTVTREKNKSSDDADNQKSLEQLQQLVLSQEQVLKSKNNKTKSTDAEIERLESLVHKWRTQTHGKNYVQDTYLSGLSPVATGQESDQLLSTSSNNTFKWVKGCNDSQRLGEYVDLSERVVETQIGIEECKRKAEIVLQDMQDEIWKMSSNSGSVTSSNPLTAAALGLTSITCDKDADSDDEAESHSESLSVSSGKSQKSSQALPEQNVLEEKFEIERSRTELEANLYLSLRLSTELEEVDHLLSASQQLLQSKGERLLNLVRQLARSPEGISPDLWEEYGELLAAYDAEVSLKRYLAACAENDNANHVRIGNEFDETLHSSDVPTLSPTAVGLHHALSPWLWCEHCKHELQNGLAGSDTPLMPHNLMNNSPIPPSFSDLPLPSPSVHSVSSLLPMLPVPDPKDSDYEDLPEEKSPSSAIISTERAIPVVLRHHPSSLSNSPVNSCSQRNSATNTDDSGNASAGSTASFASTNSDTSSTDNGSQNSSCDGGSPRPPSVSTESQDSAQSSPFSLNNNAKRGSGKSRFIFPPRISNNALRLFAKETKSPSKPNQTKNKNIFFFELPPHLQSTVIASAPTSPAFDKKRCFTPTFESQSLEKQMPFLRRNNSSMALRTGPTLFDPLGKRATSFGKGSVKSPALPSHLSSVLNQPIMYNSHCDLRHKHEPATLQAGPPLKNRHLRNCPSPLRFIPPPGVASPLIRSPASAPCSPFVINHSNKVPVWNPKRPNVQSTAPEVKKKTPVVSESKITYDNDSDTGLSSLHSTDSIDMLNVYSETLV